MKKYAIESILFPERTEKTFMEWFRYAFYNGGGILWIAAYWILFLIPIDLLAEKYTLLSMITWGVIGVFLTVATLYHRLKWMPNSETSLRMLQVKQQEEYTNILKKLGALEASLEGYQLGEKSMMMLLKEYISKSNNPDRLAELRKAIDEFGCKYFYNEGDSYNVKT